MAALNADMQIELRVKRAMEELQQAETWQDRVATINSVADMESRGKERLLDPLVGLAKADSDADVRAQSRAFLASLPHAAQKRAARELAEALKDESRHVRAYAAVALGELGPASSDHVQALNEAMKDQASVVRRAAADALGRVQEPAVDYVENMVAALQDIESEVRRGAVRGLGAMGALAKNHAAEIAKRLTDASYAVRRDASTALASLGGPAEKHRAEICDRALRDEDAEVRAAAGAALAALRPGLCVGTLVEALGDQDPKVRLYAAEALVHHGSGSNPSAEALGDALTDEASDNRHAMGDALAVLESSCGAVRAEEMVNALLRPEEEMDVQWAIARALRSVGASAVSQVDRLVEALQSEAMAVRFGGARGLWALAPHALPSAGALASSLCDDSWFVRRAAAEALGLMGEAAVPFADELLQAALHDIDDDVRRAAIETFSKQGPSAEKHMEKIANMVNDKKWVVKAAAAVALGRFGRKAAAHAHLLRSLLREADYRLRLAGVEAMGMMPHDVLDRDDIGALEDRMRLDHHDDVKAAAKALLGSMGKL